MSRQSLRPRLATLAPLVLMLAGCDGWLGAPEDPPLPGERLSVMQLQRRIEPDPGLAGTELTLPNPLRNDIWPQAGGYPSHAMGHLALPAALNRAWTADIGSGSTDSLRLTAQPILVDGVLYTLDTSASVSAFRALDGERLWQARISPQNEDDEALGGGIAFSQGLLLATAGYGEVIAMDPSNGGLVWRQRTRAPTRAAPAAADGRVFALTLDNELVALNAADGAPLWQHAGLAEQAALFGGATPAIDGSTVVVGYSSGELFALRAENGAEAWSDNLAAVRRPGALTNLSDILGLPVIDRGLVLAVTNAGRMVAIDQRTGVRVWQRDIGGTETPWSAGDLVFVLTADNEVLALTRSGGRIAWLQQLARWDDPEDRDGRITWTGPVLAGGRLILGASDGTLVELSPQDGTVLASRDIGAGLAVPPVVGGETLYLLTADGTLQAWR